MPRQETSTCAKVCACVPRWSCLCSLIACHLVSFFPFSQFVVEEDPKRIHIALYAESEEALKDYYEAAIAAGGTDNGAPGPRTYYPANLRACFVIDLDDNNIECVHAKPE